MKLAKAISLWHYEQFPLTLLAMLLLATLIITYLRLGTGKTPAPFAERLAVRLPFSIYLGWIDDRIVPTADSIRLAGELPDASLVVIPDAGHVPHEERPDLYMQAINQFVASLP